MAAKSPDAARAAYARKQAKKAAAAKKIKVSQATIDKIKARGMTKSLKKAGKSTNAEYQEAITRMYGARRASAARGAGADARTRNAFINSLSPRKPKQRGGGAGNFMK